MVVISATLEWKNFNSNETLLSLQLAPRWRFLGGAEMAEFKNLQTVVVRRKVYPKASLFVTMVGEVFLYNHMPYAFIITKDATYFIASQKQSETPVLAWKFIIFFALQNYSHPEKFPSHLTVITDKKNTKNEQKHIPSR